MEEALAIIQRYSIGEKIKNNSVLLENFELINNNIIEILNILKAESIEKCCSSFSKDILIKEDEFTTEEKKLYILDKFKEALAFLKNPTKSSDKLLKAIYLSNIVKIEYKMFNSNNYFSLLKMIEEIEEIEEGIKLKESKLILQKSENNYEYDNSLTPGSESNNNNNSNKIIKNPFSKPPWYKEICDIKLEIKQKKDQAKENPKEQENRIKEGLKDIFEQLNGYYKKGKIEFLFYILKIHKPIGLEQNYIFESKEKLKELYDQNPNKFMKKMRKYYNPIRYKGDKEEDKKTCVIMQEILKLLNEY